MTDCQIALPVNIDRVFDYQCPPEYTLSVGDLVVVPFRSATLAGVVVGIEPSDVPRDKLKSVIRRIDALAPVSSVQLRLARWMARYYRHPFGEVLALAYPRQLHRLLAETVSTEAEIIWGLTETGRITDPATLGQAPRQQELLEHLRDGPRRQSELTARPGVTRRVIDALHDKQLIGPVDQAAMRSPAGYALTAAQQTAIDQVQLNRFEAHLLEGVTSSGKTEVYLHLIEQVIEAGGQALVIVPEIGLTPQLLERFTRRLGHRVAASHSAMTHRQRLRIWADCQAGRVDVLIGTRSALFTPFPALGLIVVDEEHDASLKQMDGCRYSARDVAVQLANLSDIPVMLGSATPSLETLHNALGQRYRHHRMPARTGGASQPGFRTVDLRAHPGSDGLTRPLLEAIATQLDAGNQVLLFLNRRGFAPVLMCDRCGWYAECPHCDARMTLHQHERRLRCHHCASVQRMPDDCPECRSDRLAPVGVGTERLEQALVRQFEQTPIHRVDRDMIRRRDAFERISREVLSGQPCILLGTQMLAKGHHFPNVTLVAVIDIDQALFSSDFRAVERTAQLLTQVAGRAGRASRPGSVLIQTRHPEHPLFTDLLAHGYHRFALGLLREREAAGFPPFSHLVLCRVSAPQAAELDAFFERIMAIKPASPQVQCFGPMPAPLARRAGRTRAQLLMMTQHRAALRALLDEWIPLIAALRGSRQCRWSFDIDPQDMS